MTQEEANTALYEKMFEAQERYREHLLSMSPQDVLDHAYEYIVREDILLAIECDDINCKQAKALLKLPDPLADIFKDFEKRETDHMDNIRDTIEARANRLLREEFLSRSSAR